MALIFHIQLIWRTQNMGIILRELTRPHEAMQDTRLLHA